MEPQNPDRPARILAQTFKFKTYFTCRKWYQHNAMRYTFQII